MAEDERKLVDEFRAKLEALDPEVKAALYLVLTESDDLGLMKQIISHYEDGSMSEEEAGRWLGGLAQELGERKAKN